MKLFIKDVIIALCTGSTYAWLKLLTIFLLPAVLGVLMIINPTQLKSPAAILTMLALLFSGYLSSFVHYSTLRLKLTELEGDGNINTTQPERKVVDDTAKLLLFGAFTAAIAAAIVAIVMTLQGANITGIAAGISSYFAMIPLILFIHIVPKLRYVYLNVVGKQLGPRSY